MKVVVGKVADFENGDRKIIDVNGKSVGVFRIDDEFYAIRNRCPVAPRHARRQPRALSGEMGRRKDSPTFSRTTESGPSGRSSVREAEEEGDETRAGSLCRARIPRADLTWSSTLGARAHQPRQHRAGAF